ncbi:peptidoglycan recognition protein family protein [Coraliomargarita akajimensis]|uniref:Peptidoglycan-binding lysin domain protein n=1 Tax=Coraliomargarita akajimensis (strain DSM 45221 / IAM 15411 / JCM 23193 / KCTC 12865 / 04OKA010-24) TaxID=583355 RepID=D5EK72_CORAD|nr:peptidoglycan recognition family protein [Coraliomargarita akajimensis]ADE54821.1 Peptidoglycan-binding lysin domain protein [Coraliomargarita akajimensis DSM 45221]
MPYTRRQFSQISLFAALSAGNLGNSLWANGSTVHIVRKGETLSHISLRYNVKINAIKQANNLRSDTVRIDQKLIIPTTASPRPTSSNAIHLVQKGDTLGHIALRYGVSVSAIKQANNLRNDVVRVGQRLSIPGAATSYTSSTDRLAHVRTTTSKINVRVSNWQRIVVHHSAIKYGNAKKYDATHRQRGMKNGLAYHFLIGNGIDSGDGEIEIGPRWKKQLLGGHVKSYRTNLTAIGICLVGNFEETHPSKKQLDSFTQLVDWLMGDVLRKQVHFAGHRELKGEQTICPGRNFPLKAMHARFGS